MAFDPIRFGNLLDQRDPFAQAIQRQQNPLLPDISPEEQQGLLSNLGTNALSGLGYVGGSLSKAFGGRAIRGLLGGKPEELLSAIPFSDTLGITDPANEVHGSELLGGDHDTPFLSPQGIGGFALDVALDPATWFGGAIVKGAGRVAQLAGKGAAKYIPGAATAGNKIYDVADPLVRGAKSLFQAKVLDQVHPVMQDVAQEAYAMFPQATQKQLEKLTPLMMEMYGHVGWKPGMPVTGQVVKDLREFGSDLLQHMEMPVPSNIRPGALGTPFMPGVESVGNQLRDIWHGTNLEEVAAGLPGSKLQPDLGYTARHMTDPEMLQRAARGSALRPDRELGRSEIFTTPIGVPAEGPGSVNYLARNAARFQTPTIGLQKEIARDVLGHGDAAWNELMNLRANPATDPARLEHLESVFKQAEGLLGFTSKLNPAKSAEGFFLNNPLSDAAAKLQSDAIRIEKAGAITKGVARVAEDAMKLGGAGTPISDVLAEAGLHMPVTGGVKTATDAAKQHVLDHLISLGKVGQNATVNDLANFRVPNEVVKPLTKMLQAGSVPEGLKPFVDMVDSITNVTKGWQTQIWPASHFRNQLEGFFRNWANDAFDPTAAAGMGYAKPWLDAAKWRAGEAIPGLERMPEFAKLGLNNEQANAELIKKIWEWNIPGRHTLPSQEISGGIMQSGRDAEILGAARGSINPVKVVPKMVPTTLEEANPLAVAGVGGRTKDTFAPIKAGRELGTGLDEVNKVSVFLAKKMQGLSDLEAYRSTIASHFDFSNLSKFERNVMRRVIPFYSWQRQAVPQVISELIANPGGKTGQAIRFANELSGNEQGYRPDYLGQGIAAPLGQEDPATGHRQFLSSGGLSIEDLGNYTRAGNVMGLLNPLIKAPLELITGRNFYTGRDLTGTVPHTGSAEGDELLSASPLGRVFSTGRMLLDERGAPLTKAVNLLTGIRTTDVDMNKARAQAIRELAERELLGQEGVGKFEKVFVRPEALALLSPRELAIYRLYQQAQRRPAHTP